MAKEDTSGHGGIIEGEIRDSGIDDPATHDLGDDNGIDDPLTHDVGDDNGVDDPLTHDVGDDNGVDDPATHDLGDDGDDFDGGGSDDVVRAAGGDDQIRGHGGNDRLFGEAGDDSLEGGSGDDVIDGGSGLDAARFAGSRGDYDISRGAEIHVTARSGSDGSDTLTGVERLHFDDRSIGFDLDGTGGQAYRLYQAAFDRAPDLTGVGFWIHHMDHGLGLVDAAAAFIGSAEFRSLYGEHPDDDAFVQLLYRNVLHRDADQAGFDFWRRALGGGDDHGGSFGRAFTRAEVLAQFSESAENQQNLIGLIGNGFEFTPWDA